MKPWKGGKSFHRSVSQQRLHHGCDSCLNHVAFFHLGCEDQNVAVKHRKAFFFVQTPKQGLQRWLWGWNYILHISLRKLVIFVAFWHLLWKICLGTVPWNRYEFLQDAVRIQNVMYQPIIVESLSGDKNNCNSCRKSKNIDIVMFEWSPNPKQPSVSGL